MRNISTVVKGFRKRSMDISKKREELDEEVTLYVIEYLQKNVSNLFICNDKLEHKHGGKLLRIGELLNYLYLRGHYYIYSICGTLQVNENAGNYDIYMWDIDDQWEIDEMAGGK